jgi:hypothetical protein
MDFVNILKRTDIFYDLNEDQLKMVAEVCHEVHYHMGEMIFPEQSASDELYVIARGEVEILVDPSIIEAAPVTPRPVTIATLRGGQAFGEIALVDQGLRSAGARSAETAIAPRHRQPKATPWTKPIRGERRSSLISNISILLVRKVKEENANAKTGTDVICRSWRRASRLNATR